VIVVWDNGWDYSDHVLAFVDVGDMPLDVAQALMNDSARSEAIVAHGATMLGPEPMMLRDWASEYVWDPYRHARDCRYRARGADAMSCSCAMREKVAIAAELLVLEAK